MHRIFFDEVPAPGIGDLLSLCAAPTLEAAAMLLLGAPKAEGVVGRGVRAGIEDGLGGLSRGAASAILEQLPSHVRLHVAEQDGTISPLFGVWLTDGQDNFAAVFAGQVAVIGTGPEIVEALAASTQRVARQMAADPNMPSAARYNAAALLSMRKLSVGRTR